MQDFKKEAAGEALKLIRVGSTVGFGAGSTMANLIGLIPYSFTVTSQIIITASLAGYLVGHLVTGDAIRPAFEAW